MPGKFTFYTRQVQGNSAHFGAAEYGHAIRTLRYKPGDAIEFTDGGGQLFGARIGHVGKEEFVAEITEIIRTEPQPRLTLFCGIIKSSDRMEWTVEKCTELGIHALYFIKTQNSERPTAKVEKLTKTAIAAIKQSHRLWLPAIDTLTWAEMLNMEFDQKWIALIPEKQEPALPAQPGTSQAILIGPEGDFTDTEKAAALQAGFKPLALGHAVLRTETAAMAAAAWHAFQIR